MPTHSTFQIRAAFVLVCVVLSAQSALVVGFNPSPSTRSSCRKRSSNLALTSLIATATNKFTDTFVYTKNKPNNEDKNNIAKDLIATCKNYGQIGSKLTDEERAEIDTIVSTLSSYSDPSPAKLLLEGTHELIYSASPGGSSGALGPFVGKVTQSFLDDIQFINRVELFNGILKVELNADREVLDSSRIRVNFKETTFYVFGKEVARKEAKGVGVWKYEFGGAVTNGEEGEELFLRVLKTPSTFVIAQRKRDTT